MMTKDMYVAYDNANYENAVIKIIDPDSFYYGLEFYYSNIQMNGIDEETGDGFVSFDFTIVSEPHKEYENSEELQNLTGDILFNIIQEFANSKKKEDE